MSNTARLVYAILEFLENEIQTEELSAEAAESLDVAKQCLQVAYGVSLDNTHLTSGRPLMDMFCEGSGLSPEMSSGTTIGLTLDTTPDQEGTTGATAEGVPTPIPTKEAPTPITEEDKRRAEETKNEGNDLMKQSRFEEAAEAYSRAIALDGTNAIYFSNRAAAYNKVHKFQEAIQDCQRAIDIDPNYGKAFGRLGLAYTGLNQLRQAREAYQKACELDPSNESYRTNLEIAEQKLKDTNLGNSDGGGAAPGLNLGNLAPGLGGLDIGALMSNPMLMNMASTMLQNPNVHQMMQNMMSQAVQPQDGGDPSVAGQPGGNTPEAQATMGNLMEIGNRLATQMQTENPDLVNQVRQMAQNTGQNPGQDNNNQPPPPPSSQGGTS